MGSVYKGIKCSVSFHYLNHLNNISIVIECVMCGAYLVPSELEIHILHANQSDEYMAK